MHFNTFTHILVFVLSLLVAGLASCESGQTRTSHASKDYVGEWIGPRNNKVVIAALPGDRFEVTNYETGTPRGVAGKLIEAGGRTFAEIEALRVEGAVSSLKPVFAYLLIQSQDDRLVTRSVKPEWLQAVAAKTPGMVFSEKTKLRSGAGGVSWESDALRDKVLAMAVKDPAALGEPERYLRLK